MRKFDLFRYADALIDEIIDQLMVMRNQNRTVTFAIKPIQHIDRRLHFLFKGSAFRHFVKHQQAFCGRCQENIAGALQFCAETPLALILPC